MTPSKKAMLVLEDGTFYEGTSFGADGPAAFIEQNSMSVTTVEKRLSQGCPNIMDIINTVIITGIVNTITGGRMALQDGFHIRHAAVEHKVTCFISLDTSRAALKALSQGKEMYSIKPLPEFLD